MPTDLYPLRVLLLTVSGFVNRHQAEVIQSLAEPRSVSGRDNPALSIYWAAPDRPESQRI